MTCMTLLTRLRSRCKLSKLQLAGDFRRKLLHKCCRRAGRGEGYGRRRGSLVYTAPPTSCVFCCMQRAQCGLIKYDKYQTRARERVNSSVDATPPHRSECLALPPPTTHCHRVEAYQVAAASISKAAQHELQQRSLNPSSRETTADFPPANESENILRQERV